MSRRSYVAIGAKSISKVTRDALAMEARGLGAGGTRNESQHGRHCFPITTRFPTNAALVKMTGAVNMTKLAAIIKHKQELREGQHSVR